MACQLCGEDVKTLEHHFNYGDMGAYMIEIVLDVCMDCHYKIHKIDGEYDCLDPIHHNNPFEYESAREHERILLNMIEQLGSVTMADLGRGKVDTKYHMKKQDGEWVMEPCD